MNGISIDQQINCVVKEVKRRKAAFPKLIENGKLTEDMAMKEIVIMQQVLQTLTQLKGLTQ